MLRNSSHQCC